MPQGLLFCVALLFAGSVTGQDLGSGSVQTYIGPTYDLEELWKKL